MQLRSWLHLWQGSDSCVWLMQQKMAATRDLQYCKTDLIASKGIVFCKYSKASSALLAMEEINETGLVRLSFLAASAGPCSY